MKRLFLGIALILLGASALDAHDLLKPLAFFLAPGAEARVRALNGCCRSAMRERPASTPY